VSHFIQFCTRMCTVLVILVTYGKLSFTTGFFLMFVYAMFTYRFMVYVSILKGLSYEIDFEYVDEN
jgi:hypothetical protein